MDPLIQEKSMEISIGSLELDRNTGEIIEGSEAHTSTWVLPFNHFILTQALDLAGKVITGVSVRIISPVRMPDQAEPKKEGA